MMMNVYDYYFEKVITQKLSKTEMIEILDDIENTSSFGSNSYTAFDIYLEMSKSPNVDEDLIKRLIRMNMGGWGEYVNETYRILDNGGTKRLHAELWEDGIDLKVIKLWKSKFTSTKQLKEIWSEHLVDREGRIDKNWLKEQRYIFFRHPNAPAGTLMRNAGKEENLIEMAKNPNLIKKPAIFEKICKFAKRHSFTSARSKSDEILEALLTNNDLDWKIVAKGIDLVKQLNTAFGKISFFSDKKKEILFNFCKHPDCPDDLKSKLYELTQDEDFIPKTAKDIFLF